MFVAQIWLISADFWGMIRLLPRYGHPSDSPMDRQREITRGGKEHPSLSIYLKYIGNNRSSGSGRLDPGRKIAATIFQSSP